MPLPVLFLILQLMPIRWGSDYHRQTFVVSIHNLLCRLQSNGRRCKRAGYDFAVLISIRKKFFEMNQNIFQILTASLFISLHK